MRVEDFMNMWFPARLLKPLNSTLLSSRLRLSPLAVLAGICLMTAGALAAAPAKAGDALPSLADKELSGAIPDLKGKVVLLDIWASWCVPCRKSFPVMKELQETYGPKGFMVVAVSVDEKQPAMDSFVKRTAPPFTILRDAKGKLAESLSPEKMPTSYIVGADGKIISVHGGFEGETTRKKYIEEIEAALKAAGK